MPDELKPCPFERWEHTLVGMIAVEYGQWCDVEDALRLERERDEARAEVERLTGMASTLRSDLFRDGALLEAAKEVRAADKEEIKRLTDERDAEREEVVVLRKEREEARSALEDCGRRLSESHAEYGRLNADCRKLEMAAAEANELVLSHEGEIARLNDLVEELQRDGFKILDELDGAKAELAELLAKIEKGGA
jgi:chromosome segregation ATPase